MWTVPLPSVIAHFHPRKLNARQTVVAKTAAETTCCVTSSASLKTANLGRKTLVFDRSSALTHAPQDATV
jgi:hypothetical protein